MCTPRKRMYDNMAMRKLVLLTEEINDLTYVYDELPSIIRSICVQLKVAGSSLGFTFQINLHSIDNEGSLKTLTMLSIFKF